jgi:hypothetical protein
MMIKDLEVSKELAREELSAVRGGQNLGVAGGQGADQGVLGGGLFSPTIAVNVPVNVPTLTQTDIRPVTAVDLDLANVIGSAGTLIHQ